MRKITGYIIISLLVLSLFGNGLLLYYISETGKPQPSITKIIFGEHNSVVYCERSSDVNTVKIDFQKNTYRFGDSKLVSGEKLYLITDEGEINLSAYDAQGFVIDSNGELLYSLVAPTLKKQKVFVTPNGAKYHTDAYCAGKTGFEIDYETAIMFDREPCVICSGEK